MFKKVILAIDTARTTYIENKLQLALKFSSLEK